MGRAYAGELEDLSKTYAWAVRTPIGNISEFAKRFAGLPLYVVGSGGSLSVAAFASMLHQQAGAMSRHLTPLEFLELDGIGGSYTALIVTAGGNNGDMLSAFDRAAALRPELLGVMCASTGNRLIRKAQTYPQAIVHAASPPAGKDGFLATNSLLAAKVWLSRAYADGFSFIGSLPDSPIPLPYDGTDKKEFEEKIVGVLQGMEKKDTVVVLHDGWGGTAAFDAESKLVEAGLVGVQLADYRNFAHGRHNWLDKNGQRTYVIALVTPRCAVLAAKTIRLIPKSVPVAELSSGFDGPVASINLLVKIMYTVKFFGAVRGIDSGKPKVAQFGRKMYHLKIHRNDARLSDRERAILLRKFPGIATGDDQAVQKVAMLKKFVRRMERAKFGGIMLDYDGTMCDLENRPRGPSPEIGACLARMLQSKILVGVATGRGASIRDELRRIIPETYWHQLLIGYYNGADIGCLDDDLVPNKKSPTDPRLKAFLQAVQKQHALPENCQIDERPLQVSLLSSGLSAADLMPKKGEAQTDEVRVVESGHSIDIIPADVTKLNLLKRMRKESVRDDLQILCIGDMGKWPGNDFEMLKTKYSLSVDKVSCDADSCWNTLAGDVGGEAGTLEYLRGTKTYDGYFMLRLGVKE